MRPLASGRRARIRLSMVSILSSLSSTSVSLLFLETASGLYSRSCVPSNSSPKSARLKSSMLTPLWAASSLASSATSPICSTLLASTPKSTLSIRVRRDKMGMNSVLFAKVLLEASLKMSPNTPINPLVIPMAVRKK